LFFVFKILPFGVKYKTAQKGSLWWLSIECRDLPVYWNIVFT